MPDYAPLARQTTPRAAVDIRLPAPTRDPPEQRFAGAALLPPANALDPGLHTPPNRATLARDNRTGLPDDLKRGVETLSGIALDDIRVHRNSTRPGALGAHAYAQGSQIHLAPGQERHLPHEAWHVVQQKQGRVKATMQLKSGIPVNDDCSLEAEADRMGARALGASSGRDTLRTTAPLVPPAITAPVVQRQLTPNGDGTHSDTRDNLHAAPQTFTADAQNDGLTGHYTCNQGFHYHYDDATKRYRVIDQRPQEHYWDVAHQHEMRKITSAPDPQGRRLHHYVRLNQQGHQQGNQRYHYDPGNTAFQPLPHRARWIDTRDQFVDDMHNHNVPARRVLAPNGEGLDKQYAVTKAGRDYVVPYKRLDAGFLPGLPALYGGNVDPHETADQAVAREVTEESGNRFALGANLGQLAQAQAAWDPHGGNHQDLNRYTIRNATLVAPVGIPRARQEMAGEIGFTASHFVGHTANRAATTAHLLARFTQHVAGNQQNAQHLANLDQNTRDTWAGSHSMTTLADRIAADVQQYEGGRDGARAGQALGNAPHAEMTHGHGMYTAGAAAARAGNADPNHAEQAYRVGRDDYAAGTLAAQAGAGAGQHAIHNQAMGDYAAGLTAAQAGQAAGQHAAHNHAMADYAAGLAAAQAGQAAGADHANATAHAEYLAGLAAGRSGQAAEGPNAAYMLGHGAGAAELAEGEPSAKKTRV